MATADVLQAFRVPRGSVINCNTAAERLVHGAVRDHNLVMRALASVLVVAIILFGVYQFYLKKMPLSDEGTASTQAISLTGVRSDLLQIAQAERGNIALNSRCVSLEELVSAGAMTVNRPGRDGYTYEVNCSGSDFQVTAKHAPAPEGSPIRYPQLAIDATMRIQELPPN